MKWNERKNANGERDREREREVVRQTPGCGGMLSVENSGRICRFMLASIFKRKLILLQSDHSFIFCVLLVTMGQSNKLSGEAGSFGDRHCLAGPPTFGLSA